jgi:dihydropteroate synthase type 2
MDNRRKKNKNECGHALSAGLADISQQHWFHEAMSLPQLFGILNITEDSFSDGGRFLSPGAALAQAEKLIGDGADVLDLGGASSNPNSEPVPVETEISRLKPIVEEGKRKGWTISIDSFAPDTQRWAMGEGVDYLNDIQGFPYPEMYSELARSGAKLMIMHSVQELGRAQRIETDPETILDRIGAYFDRRVKALTQAGIARERLILDPGMGFFLGAAPEVSLTVLARLSELKRAFGLPLFVSVSRKGFLRKLTGRPVSEIGAASLAAEIYAACHGADIVRTHDPKAIRDALTIWCHIEARKSSNSARNVRSDMIGQNL